METRDFQIVHKKIEGHNVMRLTLQSPTPIEQATPSVFVRIYNDRGDSRPYTPLWIASDQIHHAIKIYDNGPLSSYLARLNVGDSVKVSAFESKREFVVNEHKNILMICGGTGITPIYQVLSHAMHTPECESDFTLLFYNTREENAFLSAELEALQKLGDGGRLEVKHITTGEEGQGGNRRRTRVTEPIREQCGKKHYDFVYVCGTDGFLETVCGAKTPEKKQGELAGVLKELGFTGESVYKF